MRIRPWLVRIHRWVGLASGLVVFVVALTGAVYVWEGELFALTHRSLVYVSPAERHQRLSADSLYVVAQRAVPAGHVVNRLTIFADRGRSVVAMAERLRDGASNYFDEFLYYEEVFLDPTTGDVLGVVDRKHEWIYITRMVHTELLLAQRGEWLVGTATLVFVAMVVFGLALWWPRNRAVLRTRLSPRLTSGWKRTVYDLHNVVGFYGTIGMLLVALTGPVWTWKWYEGGVAWLFTGRAKLVGDAVPMPVSRAVGRAPNPMEQALEVASARVPDARRLTIDIPSGKAAVLTVGAVYSRRSLWEEYERYYFDPHSAQLLGGETFDQKNLGMRWRNSNYGIHTGTLWGWPTQVLATLLALLVASLPVTGVFIWFPRWRRREVREKRPAMVVAVAGD